MADILLFVRDFELGTKLSEVFTDLGQSLLFTDENTDPNEFKDSAKMAIVDLDDPYFSSVGLIAELKRHDLKVVGFMNRVNQKDQNKIKKVGCEIILPRSSLVKNMPSLVKELLD
ncbi:MAG: hypothetical protein HN657_00510 [Candidatus Marinimicrobia bacterium]|jgi:hypothetical protein|nr:hypothetical protein [Candidatus Neomarinimicrobiota bacterium]MBT3496541.1 hypothetical protein [Candidatus Neomarinimicrobiota bacterium]MBT3691760.1 hypothetical protein [Candidatus Neomarinimicrobiota bacterium]MBT3732695.1 hypothetical protein [Candidatus Neomarinimicrobiota bacterium]MBT4144280.1 hypothetical protein [Candidatus Neomarinimicrobiota bacterium]